MVIVQVLKDFQNFEHLSQYLHVYLSEHFKGTQSGNLNKFIKEPNSQN